MRACFDAMSEIVFRRFYIYILLLVNVVILKYITVFIMCVYVHVLVQ